MDEREHRAWSGTIEGVRRRLSAWRRGRSRGRIPETLWKAVVDLARTKGANRVAEALRVDEGRLERRLEASKSRTPRRTGSVSPAFVEIGLPNGTTEECVIELKDEAGARLTVRMPRANPEHVVVIARALWGCRR
jgi:hypothetical protein